MWHRISQIDTHLLASYNPSMSAPTPPLVTVALGRILILSSCTYSRPLLSNEGDVPASIRGQLASGESLQPQSINIHSAIEKFHEQTIKPQHGTAGLVVFTLTAPDQFDQLMYDNDEASVIT